MKKLLLILSVLLLSFKIVPIEYVYVCDGKTSVAYHSTDNCKGLNRCTHTVIKVTKQDAINTYGKRACKLCW